MANHGERGLAVVSSRHGQNRSESGDHRSLEHGLDHAHENRQILDALKHIADVGEAQQKRSRLFTSMFSSSIPLAGQLFSNLHLAEESAVASAYIENNSTVSTLTVYEGPGGGGRVIGIVPPAHSKRVALADHVSSLSVTADKPDPGPALVIVTLTTRHWSPQQSAL